MVTLLCLLLRCGESSRLTLALSQPLFSQKMALVSHLNTLAARKKEETEEKEEAKGNDAETDTCNTQEMVQGGGIKQERF